MTPRQSAAAQQFLSSLPGDLSGEDLFAILGELQDTVGCIPREAVVELARRTGLSETRLFGAVTAYPDFQLTEE